MYHSASIDTAQRLGGPKVKEPLSQVESGNFLKNQIIYKAVLRAEAYAGEEEGNRE